tara:strand:+ start:63 stop:446 length:384 start_codon:yes stop_codon:yes gene_type:complete
MNKALLKAMGVNESQVIKAQPKANKGKVSQDSQPVKATRSNMIREFKKDTKLVASMSYLKPIPERDADGKIIKVEGKNLVKTYEPTQLSGDFILEDNKDGTHKATKLIIYKEEYLVCSETIQLVEVS